MQVRHKWEEFLKSETCKLINTEQVKNKRVKLYCSDLTASPGAALSNHSG